MSNKPGSAGADGQGATVVIRHRVRESALDGYEEWLDRIAPVCKAFPGHLDWHIVRPIKGLTATYTVVIRFDTREHVEAWMQSAERTRLIGEVQPLLATEDDFVIRSGLDFWFTPEGARAKLPVRWKQFLVTWSAIYPLALGVPLAVGPAMKWLGLPEWRPLMTLIVTAVIVLLMTYVVMPRYTKLLRRWLFA